MTAARPPAIWREIAGSLRHDIAQAVYPPGSRLPSEAALAARFGVNRHTVRHALAALAGDGVVVPRRGAGVFVAARPTDYPIGRRVRFHQNIIAAGRTPARQISRIETRPATGDEAEALGLDPGTAVHLVEGLSLVDGAALAAFRSVLPAARFPNLGADLRDVPSLTHAMARAGVADYTRAMTRITAKLAKPTLALRLGVAAGAPILRAVAINVDADGVPVEYGTTWFAGDRVTLTVPALSPEDADVPARHIPVASRP